jgi:ribonucleoside-diphosphate reductase beta chain
MNSTLMIQYIEFVADRLVVQLREDIQLGEPFDFNSSASSPRRTSSRRVSEYSLSDKTIDDNIFDMKRRSNAYTSLTF